MRAQSCHRQAASGAVTYYEIYSACFISCEIMQIVSWATLFWHCEHLRVSESAKFAGHTEYGIRRIFYLKTRTLFLFSVLSLRLQLATSLRSTNERKPRKCKLNESSSSNNRCDITPRARFSRKEKREDNACVEMRMARKFISFFFSLCVSSSSLIVGKFSGWSQIIWTILKLFWNLATISFFSNL